MLLLVNLLLYSSFFFCVFSGCVCPLWLNVYVYVFCVFCVYDYFCLNMCPLCLLCPCLCEFVSVSI